jgi:DNA anti-recombination protein RmuC
MYLVVVLERPEAGFIVSDPAASDRPELTRSDYDRLIALLRAAQATEEKESATTCRELDRDIHGISLRLDQMQHAMDRRFDHAEQAANARFDQMQHAMDRRFDHVEQATNDRFDEAQRGNNGRLYLMQRIFIGAAFLTIACIGYLFVATSQVSVALGKVDGRFDVVDMRFVAVAERFNGIDNRLDAMDKRLDAMDERIDKRFEQIDKRFEQIDRRLDNIVDLVGQLRPIKQQGIVDQQ